LAALRLDNVIAGIAKRCSQDPADLCLVVDHK